MRERLIRHAMWVALFLALMLGVQIVLKGWGG